VGPQGPIGESGLDGAIQYTGVNGVIVDNVEQTIGLPMGTTEGDLLSWQQIMDDPETEEEEVGGNWVAIRPQDVFPPEPLKDNMQPFLSLNYIIALQGVFPSRNSSSPFIAEVILFAGNFAPRGWAFCDGQLLSIAQNTALFSLLGTTYGGDGQTSFGLPDLRGRAALHAGSGSGPGLTSRRLGSMGGAERH
jgi:microcystin-dependent protein